MVSMEVKNLNPNKYFSKTAYNAKSIFEHFMTNHLFHMQLEKN